MNLEKLRASISKEQQQVLEEIWDYYVQTGSWIPSGALYRTFGKQKVKQLLTPLGGSIVFTSLSLGDRGRFILTFLGALLTRNGPNLELMFWQYLNYVKQCLDNDLETNKVESAAVESKLKFNEREAKIFVKALRLSPFVNGGSFSAFSSKEWSAGLPYDIDDLLSEVGIQDYFQARVLADYDPNVPIEGNERSFYLDNRARQTSPNTELPRLDNYTAEIEVAEDYNVFLSYSSLDSQEAKQLYEAILAAGGKAFLGEKSLRAGDDFAEEIRKALRASGELWLLVSPNSLRSEWVISEWGAAWALGKRIIPILFRCMPEEAPERIRRLHCVDFHKCFELIKDKFQSGRK